MGSAVGKALVSYACLQKEGPNSEFGTNWLQEIPSSKELTDNRW